MKKRFASVFLFCCAMLVVLRPASVSAAEETATITLVNQSDWEDGSGYQMLLDSTATAYGTYFTASGPLVRDGDSTEEVYSSFDYKIPTDAGWTRNTQAVVHFGSSQTIEIPAGIYDFCITNPSPGDSIWIVGTYGNTLGRANDFEFKAGYHYTFTTVMGSTGDGVDLTITDMESPVISGLENGKTYCGSVSFTASDNDAVKSVTVNGTALQPVDGTYTLAPADGTQTVVATDASGNKTTVNVTVNDGHRWQWTTENGQYWGECSFCDVTTETKSVPVLTIIGADQVCRTQSYVFSLAAPEGSVNVEAGYEFPLKGSGLPIASDGSVTVNPSYYSAEEHSMVVGFYVTLSDGYIEQVQKTVEILDSHTGGTATCKNKAVCKICGESYGELNAMNHADLTYIDAKAATNTSEGNIEYWYCCGCDKYYKDARATQKITKEQTVTAKLPSDSNEGTGGNTGNNNKAGNDATAFPQTGDNSNLALWIALLLASGGAGIYTTVYGKKKKCSVKSND